MTKPPHSLNQLNNHIDTLIIGGGIVGAGIFRDLSLHSIPSVLIDKNDFTSQTSQSSSKMLHGGIRYLENFDFSLVREALHEKNLWLKLTPHLAYPQKFLIPVYKTSKRPLWMLKIGLFLYDFLSSFKNIPHQILNSQETLQYLPDIRQEGLIGAGVYSDAVVDDAKLTLEIIYDAQINCSSSKALSYTELIQLKAFKDGYIVTLKDRLSAQEKSFSVNNLIFATGPFTDKLIQKLNAFPWRDRLLPSRGSHLWLKKEDLDCKRPLVLTPDDGRVIFVIPQRNKILVGTTEVSTEVEDNITPSQEEIDYLIKNVQEFFPKSNVTHQSIISSYAGIRPLVKEEDSLNLGKTARNHKVYQPSKSCWVIVGGKYTTFRVMAQDIVKEICHKKAKAFNPLFSQASLSYTSQVRPFQEQLLPTRDQVKKILFFEKPRTLDDFMIRRLGIATKKHWNEPDQLKNFLSEHEELLRNNLENFDQQISQWI